MWIQLILLLAIAVIALFAMRAPRGARHVALRRVATVLFAVFAVATILFPDVWTSIANRIGIGRGADLLLYLLVIVVLGYMATSYSRNRAMENQITQLARRIALDSAGVPPAAQAPQPEADDDSPTASAERTS